MGGDDLGQTWETQLRGVCRVRSKHGEKCNCHLKSRKYAISGHAQTCPRFVKITPNYVEPDPDWSTYEANARRSYIDPFVQWATDPFQFSETGWFRRFAIVRSFDRQGYVWQMVKQGRNGVVSNYHHVGTRSEKQFSAIDDAVKDACAAMLRVLERGY